MYWCYPQYTRVMSIIYATHALGCVSRCGVFRRPRKRLRIRGNTRCGVWMPYLTQDILQISLAKQLRQPRQQPNTSVHLGLFRTPFYTIMYRCVHHCTRCMSMYMICYVLIRCLKQCLKYALFMLCVWEVCYACVVISQLTHQLSRYPKHLNACYNTSAHLGPFRSPYCTITYHQLSVVCSGVSIICIGGYIMEC